MNNQENTSGDNAKSENPNERLAGSEEPSLSQVNSGARAKSEVKTKRRRSRRMTSNKLKWFLAIITGVTPLLVALFNFPPFIALFEKSATTTVTLTLLPTSFVTNTSRPFLTDTPPTVITPTITITPTVTVTLPSFTASPTPPAVMFAKITADKMTGKTPLIVKFDARDSYLLASDGQHPCLHGPCNYTWKIYFNSVQLGKSVNDAGGTLDYTFGHKGTYLVTVFICRGKDRIDCGGNGIFIVAL